MILVVGVGNSLRKDDGIGVRIVEELKKEIKNPEIEFFLGETVPENLIKKINELKPKRVFIIDAVDFSGNTGDVMLIENQKGSGFTHKLSYNLFSKLLNCEVKILGIQPKDIDYGEELSDELKKKMNQIKTNIVKLISI
jgi:hydrogenase maturation protease